MTAISGQVKGDGTQRLGSDYVQGPIAMKALLGNAGTITITDYPPGGAGSEHIELAAGDVFIFDYVGNLDSIWFDSDNAGDGVSWIRLDV